MTERELKLIDQCRQDKEKKNEKRRHVKKCDEKLAESSFFGWIPDNPATHWPNSDIRLICLPKAILPYDKYCPNNLLHLGLKFFIVVFLKFVRFWYRSHRLGSRKESSSTTGQASKALPLPLP